MTCRRLRHVVVLDYFDFVLSCRSLGLCHADFYVNVQCICTHSHTLCTHFREMGSRIREMGIVYELKWHVRIQYICTHTHLKDVCNTLTHSKDTHSTDICNTPQGHARPMCNTIWNWPFCFVLVLCLCM